MDNNFRQFVIGWLNADDDLCLLLNGIYNGAVARAAMPYMVVESGQMRDNGVKDRAGCLVTLAFVVRDFGDHHDRLDDIAHALEARLMAMPMMPENHGWQCVTLNFQRSRRAYDSNRNIAMALDYQAYLLAKN